MTAPEPAELNVFGEPLQPCGTEPMTGYFRDGSCRCGPSQTATHTVCAVVTREFLEHQRSVGNDLTTARPSFAFPGLVPGDRWCVVAARWLQAYRAGAAAPVVLASTNRTTLEIIPLAALREHAVDVPGDLSSLS